MERGSRFNQRSTENIGNRQKGKLRGNQKLVIETDCYSGFSNLSLILKTDIQTFRIHNFYLNSFIFYKINKF